MQPLSNPISYAPPVLPHARLSPTVSPFLLSPVTPNKEGAQSPLDSLWKSKRLSPSQDTRGLAAAPPEDLVDAPATPPFTEIHGVGHPTSALTPIYEQSITGPSGPRHFHWAHQEQLDVMARSLVNAKAESEALKRKCARLQQTVQQLRERSTALQSDEEGERTSRSGQKSRLRFMNVERELHALPSGSQEVSVPRRPNAIQPLTQYYRPQEIAPSH